MPQALALPTHQELMSLPKDELAGETLRIAQALDTAKTKAKDLVKEGKEKAKAAAMESLTYLAAGTGAAAAGAWMGSIQKDIDAGTEGYTEDSKTLMGVDKDIALGVVLAGMSYSKGLKKWKPYLRQSGIGAISFYIGRKAFEFTRKPDEDEDAVA